MSSGGTRSVIHYDADHNLHCLIVGRKDFIMIDKEQYENLYFNKKVRLIIWTHCAFIINSHAQF